MSGHTSDVDQVFEFFKKIYIKINIFTDVSVDYQFKLLIFNENLFCLAQARFSQ